MGVNKWIKMVLSLMLGVTIVFAITSCQYLLSTNSASLDIKYKYKFLLTQASILSKDQQIKCYRNEVSATVEIWISNYKKVLNFAQIPGIFFQRSIDFWAESWILSSSLLVIHTKDRGVFPREVHVQRHEDWSTCTSQRKVKFTVER